MRVLVRWLLCLLLEAMWSIFLKVTANKYVSYLHLLKFDDILVSNGRILCCDRWQHRCRKRQMASQVILIFLPSWFACSTMSPYMYDFLYISHVKFLQLMLYRWIDNLCFCAHARYGKWLHLIYLFDDICINRLMLKPMRSMRRWLFDLWIRFVAILSCLFSI